MAVLSVEALKVKLIKPHEEFDTLRRRVDSLLGMYANLYCNRIMFSTADSHMIDMYNIGAEEIRKSAMDLNAFIAVNPRKYYRRIPREDITDRINLLILLSNSFFQYSYNDITDNSEIERKVKEKLRLLKN